MLFYFTTDVVPSNDPQKSRNVTTIKENMTEDVISANYPKTEKSKDEDDTAPKERMLVATTSTHAALPVDNELVENIRCEEKYTDDMCDRRKQGACFSIL